MQDTNIRKAYWRANMKLVGVCLCTWFMFSYMFGIILFEPLNTFYLGGYPLGFWFAQQGSIFAFVLIIFLYTRRMNTLDRKYGFQED